jgi:hypothetical protein
MTTRVEVKPTLLRWARDISHQMLRKEKVRSI